MKKDFRNLNDNAGSIYDREARILSLKLSVDIFSLMGNPPFLVDMEALPSREDIHIDKMIEQMKMGGLQPIDTSEHIQEDKIDKILSDAERLYDYLTVKNK